VPALGETRTALRLVRNARPDRHYYLCAELRREIEEVVGVERERRIIGEVGALVAAVVVRAPHEGGLEPAGSSAAQVVHVGSDQHDFAGVQAELVRGAEAGFGIGFVRRI